MGDAADDLYFHEIDTHMNSRRSHDKNNQQDFKWWVMGNGDTILVTKMTIQHLRNSLNKILRDNWREQWYEPLKKELQSRTTTDTICDATESDLY